MCCRVSGEIEGGMGVGRWWGGLLVDRVVEGERGEVEVVSLGCTAKPGWVSGLVGIERGLQAGTCLSRSLSCMLLYLFLWRNSQTNIRSIHALALLQLRVCQY